MMIFALRLHFKNGTVNDVAYYRLEDHAIEHRDKIRQILNHPLSEIIRAEVIPIDVIPKPANKLLLPEEIGELVERCRALQSKITKLPEGVPLFNSTQGILEEEYHSLMSQLAEFLDKENFDLEPFNPYLTGKQLEWLRQNRGEIIQHLQGVAL